nr:PREDICTED: uncharacterized protein LOC102348188 [Latimeria chalumnae]|eukprot:XP_005987419.1 PREDICTED: uncharacterized protein LOC102348188 [Latimeria chalumnae]
MMETEMKENLYRVKLEQRYWLGEKSEAKLQQLGATCVDNIIEDDHFYDTDTCELALNQIWLSQRKKQWHLIFKEHESDMGQLQSTANNPQTNVINTSHSQNTLLTNTRNVRSRTPDIDKSWIGKLMGLHDFPQNPRTNQQDEIQWLDANKANFDFNPKLAYYELTTEREIIAHLAQRLHIALSTEEERDMTVEMFLQLARIQHYASWYTTKRTTYKLQDTYTIVMEMDKETAKNIAVVTMDADIENIISEFGRMEKRAKELELELSQSTKLSTVT